MLSGKEMSVVFEMLPVFFEMTDSVKVTLHVEKKTAFLMTKLIELGLSTKNDNPGLFSIIDDGTLEQLKKISTEILQKAGLTDLNQKLLALSSK